MLISCQYNLREKFHIPSHYSHRRMARKTRIIRKKIMASRKAEYFPL